MNRLAQSFLGTALALALLALPVVALLRGWLGGAALPVRWLDLEAEFNRVSAEQLRASVAPQVGAGFFAVSLEAVKSAAEALPWVAHVEARKIWPDTLKLRVIEHEPLAHWNDRQLITRAGARIDPPGQAWIAGLPRLFGPDAYVEQVLAFHDEVLGLLAGTGLQLEVVSLNPLGAWTLELSGGARIELGRERPRERLARFVRVYPRLGSAPGASFSHADLRYGNGFALRWGPASVDAFPVEDET